MSARHEQRLATAQQQSSLWDPPPRRSFWSSLDAQERADFVADAHLCLFQPGMTLCQQDERTNTALVITSGWAKVSITSADRERIVAFRGPGDLVGERAALATQARSASVAAFNDVTALAMPAERFRGYLLDHQRVGDLLQFQEDERTFEDSPRVLARTGQQSTDEAATDQFGADDGLPSSVRPPHRLVRGTPHDAMSSSILLTDLAGFGDRRRTDDDRRIMREMLYRILRDAFGRSHLAWSQCHQEDRGDGTLTVVPSAVPTEALVDPLVAVLAAALRHHNRQSAECVRLRLRLAIHTGPVAADADGVHGQALIDTARLLEAPALKTAMSEQGADLGVITSSHVYHTVVAHTVGLTDPAEYRPVRVRVKEVDTTGWMFLAGGRHPAVLPRTFKARLTNLVAGGRQPR